MSHWDAKKINIMYSCHAGGGGGGHLSWSPEHDHDDPGFIDDSVSPRNASSAPSSSEIEVAYDELDYDPGRSGGGKRARSRSFHTDDHNHDDQDYLGDEGGGGGGGSSSENFGGSNHNNNNDHGGSRSRGYNSHHPPQSPRYSHDGHGHNNHFDSSIGHHDNSHNSNNPYPQSYAHFSLDTYPGGGDGGEGEADVGHDENNSIASDDFYDF